jgi:trk system potassium uptake protein TrkH
VVLSLGMIAAILLVLLVSGGVRVPLEQAFLQSAFEVVSAFGTVGLSTGVTPGLAVHGKLLIMLTMLVGRTGPLVAAVAISRQQRRQLVRLPDGEILVG